MSEDDRYELRIAGWLHDCGKVTTPGHVMDKAVKLESIHDRIQDVASRFEILKRDRRLELMREQLAGRLSEAECVSRYSETVEKLEEERTFLERCNVGGEFMREEDKARVRARHLKR